MMGKFTVTTPVPGHNGPVGGVTFVDGTAVVDDTTHPSELAYLRGAGYEVTEVGAEPVEPDDLDALRAEAADLGLKVHHNAKADTIRKQIDDARNADEPDSEPGNDEETQS